MKKLVVSLVIAIAAFASMVGCKAMASDDVKRLMDEADRLTIQNRQLDAQVNAKSEMCKRLNLEIAEKKIIASGATPLYILRLELRQNRVSLDISEHAKDAMNAVEFEIPVDKSLYDKLDKGDMLLDEMRKGSMWIEGSFSSWNVKVVDKKIVAR